MGFNTALVPLQFPERIGFRDDATGDLSVNWNIAQGAAADIQVKTDTVNIAWNPTSGGAGAAVTAIHTVRSTTTPGFRLAASQRFVSTPTGAAVGVGAWLPLTSGAFSFGARRYGIILQSDAPTRLTIVHEGTTISFTATLVANTWYRTGIEIEGTTVRYLFNPTGNATITSVSSDADMVVAYEKAITSPAASGLLCGISLSAKAVGASDYTGVGDVQLTSLRSDDELRIPTGGFGRVTVAHTPYTRYKSGREAMQILNNLVIGP